MTYTPIDHYHPVISNNKIATENWGRSSLVNLRDFIVCLGIMPQWDLALTPGAGSDYTQPTEYIYTRGTEAIKVSIAWNANGYPDKLSFYFSENSKLSWDPLTDRSGNFVLTCSYDSNHNCTAETWGVS